MTIKNYYYYLFLHQAKLPTCSQSIISPKKTLQLMKKGNKNNNREDGGTRERKRQKKATTS